MGSYQAPSEATVNLMDAARAQLQRDALDTATNIYTTPGFVTVTSGVTDLVNWFRSPLTQIDTFDTSKEAAQNRIGQLQQAINTLCEDKWFSVMSGEMSSKSWFATATAYEDELKSLNAGLSAWSFGGVGEDMLRADARDLADYTKKAIDTADNALKSTPYLLMLVGLLGVCYLVFKFKR